MDISQFQKLLDYEWMPIVSELILEHFNPHKISENITPHVSYNGYLALVDGGGEYLGMIDNGPILEDGWFASTVGPQARKYLDYLLEDVENEDERDEIEQNSLATSGYG